VTTIDSALADALRDRYVLERELGRGGMATVYLARDLRHRRYVALKRLAPELATAVGVERFEREIQLAASLQHPHILPVHDSGDAGGVLWYTMPYVEGESLRERLRRETRLGIDEAVSLAREVAEALDCAHAAGIVHRDIKPENILLSGGHALVADFGIARAAQEAGETLTATGLVIGTPAYMSPEQAGGTGQATDARSDIYSLGCVLYEMLAGERPFGGPTPHAMLVRRLMEPPPDPRLARPAVPDAVAAIVARSLAVDPEDRFGTAGELIAALRAAQQGRTLEAVPSAATATAMRRRGRHVWAAAAAVVLLLAAGAAWLARGVAARPALDDTLLAVAPFDVLEPSLALWHEGLMDVFSRTLDGVGALRTVSPAVIAHRWPGRADHASAAELARSTGAARVLYGALIPAGGDSARLTASLLDARTGQAVAEFDLRGPRDRVDRLADSLTLAVLRALAPPTALAAPAGSPLGTASPTALKAFLEGEQYYRRSEFDLAQPAFRRAVALDSGFGLAWHRLSQSVVWRDSSEGFTSDDPEVAIAAFRAASVHGLSVRDSLLLTGDSLFWAMFVVQEPAPQVGFRFDERFWSFHTRLFRTLEEARRRYPQDPEVVLSLAEARWQWGGATGRPLEETLALYDRAIALDSAFTPSYPHAAFVALAAGDPSRALRYVHAHLHWGPSASVRGVLALTEALLTPGVGAYERADRLLDSLPVYALSKTFGLTAMSADSGEAVVRVVRALVRRNPQGEWAFLLGSVLGARGHFGEMQKVSLQAPNLLGWVAALAPHLIPADSLRRYRATWSRTTDPWHEQPFPFLHWLASEGDTAVLAHVAAVIKSGSDDEAIVRAFLALASRDTTRAVTLFLAMPDSAALLWWSTRLEKARLLRATGHLSEAARTLRPTLSPWGSDYLAGDGFWHLERGRIYERLGDRSGARRAYGTVVDLWRHADPELQPLVAEARDAVARLGERSP
jgi:serine/threonine-protein kinase